MSENPLAAWLTEPAVAHAPDDRAAERTRPERPPVGMEPPDSPTAASSGPAAGAAPRGSARRGGVPTRRLWRLAAVPWALALLLGLLAAGRGAIPDHGASGDEVASDTAASASTAPTATGDAADQSRDATPESAASPSTVAGAAGADGPDVDAPDAGRGTTDPVEERDDADIRAAAAVAMRLALTEAGAERDRYVDLVAPDGLEWRDEVAIVTASVVLLEGRGGVWEDTRPARYAIALQRGPDGVHPVGPPWPVPGGGTPAPAPEAAASPVEDQELAAALVAALERAGYADVALHGLLPPPAPSLLRLRLHGAAPGDARPRDHDLLLDASPPHDVLGST